MEPVNQVIFIREIQVSRFGISFDEGLIFLRQVYKQLFLRKLKESNYSSPTTSLKLLRIVPVGVMITWILKD